MEKVGKNDAVEGGSQPGVRPVLQVFYTGGTIVRFGVLGAVRRDDKGGAGQPCGVLIQITGKQEILQAGRACETPAAEEVIRMAGMQLAAKYIRYQKETVVQWAELHSLLEVCVQATSYKGEGWKRLPWCRQGTPEEALRKNLEETSQGGNQVHRYGGGA